MSTYLAFYGRLRFSRMDARPSALAFTLLFMVDSNELWLKACESSMSTYRLLTVFSHRSSVFLFFFFFFFFFVVYELSLTGMLLLDLVVTTYDLTSISSLFCLLSVPFSFNENTKNIYKTHKKRKNILLYA